MKFLAFTFDDGRDDNFEYAFPILNSFKYPATIYCTTGFIDGSWIKSKDWLSAGKPVTISQLHILKDHGWEIGIHGDKHITEYNDTLASLKKMFDWGLLEHPIGFSYPNSLVDSSILENFEKTLCPSRIAYLRRGRKIDTAKFSSKLLFGFYTYFGSQKAFNLFNKSNLQTINSLDLKSIFSIVVRHKDKPKMILKFIEEAPDNSIIVLMLHSILPKKHPLFGKDAWNWDKTRFFTLVEGLKGLETFGKIKVDTLFNILCSKNYIRKNG